MKLMYLSSGLQGSKNRFGLLHASVAVASIFQTPTDLLPFGVSGVNVMVRSVQGGGCAATSALLLSIVGSLFFLAALGAPGGDVSAPLVFLVGIGDFLADDDPILDDHPGVERFVPIQKATLPFLRDVQQNSPGHGDLVPRVIQGIVFVVGGLDEAAVETVSGIVRTDLGLSDDDVVGSRAFHDHRLAVIRRTPLLHPRSAGGGRFEELHCPFVVQGLLQKILTKKLLLLLLLLLKMLLLPLKLLLLIGLLLIFVLFLLLFLLSLLFDVSSRRHPLRVMLAFQRHCVSQG